MSFTKQYSAIMPIEIQLLLTWSLSLMLWAMLSLLVAIPTLILWNWLVPELFGLSEIGITEAWGLLILSKMLFGQLATNITTSVD